MLYQNCRPSHWREVVGNADTVKYLESAVENSNRPHAYLMMGPSGSGKTTLARILAKELGCCGSDLTEVDVGDYRGIDSVREIRQAMHLRPMVSSCRVWILDECFAAGTSILMEDGTQKRIENIQVGDSVVSLYGKDTVVNTFQKKISLNRLTKVHLQNKKVLYCSDMHEFLTDTGWKHAKNLTKKDCIFPFTLNLVSNIMKDVNLLTKENINENSTLFNLPHSFIQRSKKILFQEMSRRLQSATKAIQTLFTMWRTHSFFSEQTRQVQQAFLQPILCSETQDTTTRNTTSSLLERNSKKDFSSITKFSQDRKRRRVTKSTITKNERESNEHSFINRKGKANKTNKWNSSLLAGRTWWKRFIYNSPITSCDSSWMEDGNCYSNKKEIPISHIIQSGHRKSGIKNSDRSGWQIPQVEKWEGKRPEERRIASVIRVEGIEVFQSEYNEQSFDGIVTDKEKDQKYITLYDIEMKKHPSYFANGIAVHNCQKLTGDAQSALLKALEDAPKYSYFILATTDPQKLLNTIINRCTPCPVKTLTESEMEKVLLRAARTVKFKLSREAIDSLIEVSNGTPRAALVALEKHIANPEAVIEDASEASKEIKDLCQVLMKKQSWKAVAKVLVLLKGKTPEEDVRRAVLGYAAAIRMKGSDDAQALVLLDIFKDPFYNSGWPGLVWACSLAVQS